MICQEIHDIHYLFWQRLLLPATGTMLQYCIKHQTQEKPQKQDLSLVSLCGVPSEKQSSEYYYQPSQIVYQLKLVKLMSLLVDIF